MATSITFSLVFLAAVICATSASSSENHATAVGPLTQFSHDHLVSKNFKCPALYGRYAHPDSCEYYFLCRFGWPTLMHCNQGYLYDEEREQCREKNKVNCHKGNKDNKDKDDNTEEPMKNFKCPYIWGTFAHPYDCSKYFICLYSLPTLFYCYPNYLFDAKARKCIHRSRVDCGKRFNKYVVTTTKKPAKTTTPKPETTTPQTRKRFYCPFLYGRYANSYDCSQYYECRFAVPFLYQCPKSTLYDERKEQCIDKQRVRCGNRPGGFIRDQRPEEKEKIFCPYAWGTFSHPFDCSKYIVCLYNIPTLFRCTRNDLFHAYYRRCLPKGKVTCDRRINPDDLDPDKTTTPKPTIITAKPTTTTSEPTTTTPEPTTTTPEPTTTTPEPTTTTPEPTTTTQDPITTTIVPEATTTSIIEPVTKPNTPPPTDCDEDDLDCIIDITGDIKGWYDCPKRYGHFPHGSSRQLFIHCDNWRPFIKKCADKTFFSPQFQVCMWASSKKGNY